MLISSLPMKILSQGWFSPTNFIPDDENFLPKMILLRLFHPCWWKFSPRDDSPPLISSLPIKILSQGWFFSAYFIPADENSLPGMILPCQFHPCRWKSFLRDDPSPLISSLPMKIFSQGWFSPANFIPADENLLSRMILRSEEHPLKTKSILHHTKQPVLYRPQGQK